VHFSYPEKRTRGLHSDRPIRASIRATLERVTAVSAVITPAFNLPSQYVIHAVGPRWLDGQRGEPELLGRCYESIFSLAREHQISSLAIPSISTGIYHYPLDAAVEVAVKVARQFDSDNLTTIFACFDDATLATYQKHLGGRPKSRRHSTNPTFPKGATRRNSISTLCVALERI